MPNKVLRRVRIPLSLKILGWFLANLTFILLVAWIFIRTQLGLGLDALLSGAPGERLEALGQLVSDDLKARPRSEWPAALARVGGAYRLSVGLWRNDGKSIAGSATSPPNELLTWLIQKPPEVNEPVRAPRPPPGPGMGPEGNPPYPDRLGPDRPPRGSDRLGPRPPRDPRDPPPQINDRPPLERPQIAPPAPPAGPPRILVRAGNPPRYWIGIRLRVEDRTTRPEQGMTLVLVSDTLKGGGLLIDFTPWLLGGAAVLLLSVLLWLPLVRGITRALRQMTGAAEAIAEGRFDTHVESSRGDELGRLATSLNDMATRLREFFTGQKRFLGDIAHELCSPLARMEMALGILEQQTTDPTAHGYVADVREETRHMASLVSELLSFSKAGMGGRTVELHPLPLAELVGKVIARETRDAIEIHLEIPPKIVVLAEPELLSRAIGNVLRNAVRYATPAGANSISVTAVQRGEGPVFLTVRDSGPGVPEAALHRLFDPFFRPEAARTRETGGAGLGLAIVKSCVEACGGTVTARNVLPSGLELEFILQPATP